jgi:hypothetical protein
VHISNYYGCGYYGPASRIILIWRRGECGGDTLLSLPTPKCHMGRPSFKDESLYGIAIVHGATVVAVHIYAWW